MQNKLVDEKTGRFLPILYPLEAPYWEATKRHELRLQRCPKCDKVWFPIGPVCPSCLSEDLDWALMSGRGKVSSFVVYHKAWAPWLESRVPYTVAQVELEEGPRLTANLLGVEPSKVKIGMQVKVVYEKVNEEVTLIQFSPVAT